MAHRTQPCGDSIASVAVGVAERSGLAARGNVVSVGGCGDDPDGNTVPVVCTRAEDHTEPLGILDYFARTRSAAGLGISGSRRGTGLRASTLVDLGGGRDDPDWPRFALFANAVDIAPRGGAKSGLIPAQFPVQ